MAVDLVGGLKINKGATWTMQLTLRDAAGNPINLTGYSVRMQLRVAVDAAAALITLDNASNGGASITNASGGVVTFTMTPNQTAALPEGVVVYAVERESGGVVAREPEGRGLVTPEIAR